MERKDTKLAARSLAGFLAAGLTMTSALQQMSIAQPAYSAFWKSASRQVMDGFPLSKALQQQWPETLVEVVKAGESSGNVEAIFRGIHETLTIEDQVIANLRQILYPIFMMVAGLGMGLFYMVVVIPSIADKLEYHDSAVLSFSLLLRDLKNDYGWQLLIGVLLAGFAIMQVLRAKETREAAMDLALSVPYLNKAIAELRFGLWARYVALSLRSGIGAHSALAGTRRLVSGPMRVAVSHLIQDLGNNRSLEQAVDLENLPSDDPRREWLPFLICSAFATGSQTGRLDESLSQVSPELIAQGTERINRVASIGRALAIGLAAGVIVTPLGIAYLQIIQSMEHVL